MEQAYQAVESAIRETTNLRAYLAKGKSTQVKSPDERLIVKATARTWFATHRPTIATVHDTASLKPIDEAFERLLGYSERHILRSKIRGDCKQAVGLLVEVRATIVKSEPVRSPGMDDKPPDFSPLVQDVAMQEILNRRWAECLVCIRHGAPLSATVMMGGLVEALLLARVNRETNKAPIFTARTAPKDKAGKTLLLPEWTLKGYLDVAHELKWVSNSAKDVGVVLRDYRNYIHPNKELTHGVKLNPNDARMFWDVCKNISREVIASI
jgi:hypothetical protein